MNSILFLLRPLRILCDLCVRLSDHRIGEEGDGYVSDFPVERIWRDVRVCQIYEGTSDVQKIIIQRALA